MKFLFHGSRGDAYGAIMSEGFDFRLAQLTGAIGAGIYCRIFTEFSHSSVAESSGTSSAYVSGGSTKKMLLCRVTLGEVGMGVYGLRRPPEKKHYKGKGSSKRVVEVSVDLEEIYDSVGNGGGVFVIFDNRQAYPEYIISYY